MRRQESQQKRRSWLGPGLVLRFPSSPVEIRVPFFLLFGFNKGTQKEKRAKGSCWATQCLVCKVRESPVCTPASLIGADMSRTLPDESSSRPLPTPSAVSARLLNVATCSSKSAFTVALLPLRRPTSTAIDIYAFEPGRGSTSGLHKTTPLYSTISPCLLLYSILLSNDVL